MNDDNGVMSCELKRLRTWVRTNGNHFEELTHSDGRGLYNTIYRSMWLACWDTPVLYCINA